MKNQAAAGDNLLVTIGGKAYLLPVFGVESILSLRLHTLSPVPFDRGGRICGIFHNKGAVTALVRCPGLPPVSPVPDDAEQTVVILSDNGRRFAIAVDATHAVTGAHSAGTLLDIHSLYTGECPQ